MKSHFYSATDSLYIDLSDEPSVESQEVSPGILLDFDETGQICGIAIDHAIQRCNLTIPELEGVKTYLLSESALAKDWLRPKEDEAWRDL